MQESKRLWSFTEAKTKTANGTRFRYSRVHSRRNRLSKHLLRAVSLLPCCGHVLAGFAPFADTTRRPRAIFVPPGYQRAKCERCREGSLCRQLMNAKVSRRGIPSSASLRHPRSACQDRPATNKRVIRSYLPCLSCRSRWQLSIQGVSMGETLLNRPFLSGRHSMAVTKNVKATPPAKPANDAGASTSKRQPSSTRRSSARCGRGNPADRRDYGRSACRCQHFAVEGAQRASRRCWVRGRTPCRRHSTATLPLRSRRRSALDAAAWFWPRAARR